jgi:hypothetical protein
MPAPLASRSPLDSATLQKLAERPAQPLFVTLRKAAAMRPLVTLLALVPPLLIAAWQPFSASEGAQGLAALNVWQAGHSGAWLDPAAGTSLAGQPPLLSWCLAGLMKLLHPASLLVFPLATAVGVGLFVWAGATLARLASGDRGALVAALFLASNPLTVAQSMHLGPAPLGAGLALLSLVWLLEDWQQGSVAWSWRRWAGGLALGGSLLASPAAGVGAMLLAAVLIWGTTVGWKWALAGQAAADVRLGPGGWARVWGGLLWFAVGLFVGGWWLGEIPQLVQQAVPAVATSLSTDEQEWSGLVRSAASRLLGSAYLLWLLVPWCLLAADRKSPVQLSSQRGRGAISPLGRSVALASAGALLVLGPGSTGLREEVWGVEGLRLFLLAPIVAVGSAGAVRLMDRRVGWRELARGTVLAVLGGWVAWRWGGLVVWRFLEVTSRGMGLQLLVLLAVTGWLLLVGLVWRRLGRQPADRVVQGLLLTACGVLGGGGVLWGVSHLVPRDRGAERDFLDLRNWLRQVDGKQGVHLMGPRERIPLEIAYGARSLWTELTTAKVVDWNRFAGPDSHLTPPPALDLDEGETILVWFPPEAPRGGGVPRWLESAGPSFKYQRGELAWYRLVSSKTDVGR